MYLISEVANKVGVSRTALLYYEKLKIITSKRSSNGYRVYSEIDIQRIKLLQLLMAAGLTLKECKACLEAEVDRELLEDRLKGLDEEISQKQRSRVLLAALLGYEDPESWHVEASKLAPDAHLDWLVKQGFNEKEALRLKWLSKNMTEHEQYMNDFLKIFETVDRWGPGSESDTLRALSLVPQPVNNILEIGCGKGLATLVLAQNTSANIIAVDNEQSALDHLNSCLERDGLNSRVKTLCTSMTDMSLENQSFDLIWTENSAYIMGVENAISSWKPLIKNAGILMLSDLVWLTEDPSKAPKEFWDKEYPDMQSVVTRNAQFENSGYELLSSFTISHSSWENYYDPLSKRADELRTIMPNSAALEDLQREIDIYKNYIGEFGYQMFILKNI